MNALTKAVVMALALAMVSTSYAAVRLKEIARIEGIRDNELVGYGLVVGLAGTGDTRRSKGTLQSVRNMLERFDVTVMENDISSRNVAAVAISATLPAFANTGDRVDVAVSSIGDARSLAGGTLLMAPLNGPDGQIYALAQGPLSVGGFSYDFNGNLKQKNHPTVGRVPEGALVERRVGVSLAAQGELHVMLHEPDFTTAARIEEKLAVAFPSAQVQALDASRIRVVAPGFSPVALISKLESITVEPDQVARIVINERTGTVVAGGQVRLGDVTVAYGDLRVSIDTSYNVSQPLLVRRTGPGVRSVVTPETDIEVDESAAQAVALDAGATIADLVEALRALNASTRDIIAVLQSIKTAGALHGDLVIQ